jgi:hypothetical protein
MRIRNPNAPTEQLEHSSQRDWLITREPFIHPSKSADRGASERLPRWRADRARFDFYLLGMACFITNAKFFQVFDSVCPKEDPPHQLEDRL